MQHHHRSCCPDAAIAPACLLLLGVFHAQLLQKLCGMGTYLEAAAEMQQSCRLVCCCWGCFMHSCCGNVWNGHIPRGCCPDAAIALACLLLLGGCYALHELDGHSLLSVSSGLCSSPPSKQDAHGLLQSALPANFQGKLAGHGLMLKATEEGSKVQGS
eukprot:644400-Pelagomonas_calceolata.AAC.3